jgi:116 kDa U5 small nuclear ribonucleoprotein component
LSVLAKIGSVMDPESLYDEFGNYIGPDLDSDSADDGVPEPRASDEDDAIRHSDSFPANGGPLSPGDEMMGSPEQMSTAVVLAEDKQHYPSAEQVFGPGTETMVEEEDTQHISVPLVAPRVTRVTVLSESPDRAPRANYDHEYLASAILSNSSLIRNIALVGNLHHGKTTLADMLFRDSHEMPWNPRLEKPLRYMDVRPDERKLEISVKTNAATFLLPSLTGKSYGLNVLDTPGHPNFFDEATAAMNIVDGVVVLVDAAEGVGLGTELLLRKAVSLRLDIVLVVSKIDRLILELRLPPADAYHKIRHVIDTVNILSPARGNVAFSASTEQVCFTLHQFAQEYIERYGGPHSAHELAKRLWGDSYFNVKTRLFSKVRPSSNAERSFVEFVLAPLYKLHTAVVSDDVDDLAAKLARNDIKLRHGELKTDVRCLMRTVMGAAFGLGKTAGLVDMIARFVRPPDVAGPRKVQAMGIVGNEDESDEWIRAMIECRGDRREPMIAYIGKLCPTDGADVPAFDSLLRVMSGQLHTGDRIRILGENYDFDFNDEEQAHAVVEKILIPCARFNVEVSRASAGQIVLVKGIDETVFKSATAVSSVHPQCKRVRSLRPLSEILTTGVVKIAVEPVRPSELPKMIDGLRKCLKSYPGLVSKVEESGEHILIGSGELYMDCVMRDLRETFAGIEVKISDPVVPFAETVTESSAFQCYADTPNQLNKLTMMAEPLEDEIVRGLAEGRFSRASHSKKGDDTPGILRELGWDALAARSLWAFGPHPSCGPNVLVNDVLDPMSKAAALTARDSIVQGFNWAVREGPLTDEPVRDVKFRLLDATIANTALGRSAAQLIPAARRVAYSSMLTASARLLEPVYLIEVTCPQPSMAAVYTIIQRRRGQPLSDGPIAGTPLFSFRGFVPVLDSFGLEADLRGLTQGAAFCVLVYDHWAVVPGDPLDRSVELRPLEPAGRRELARECMVKTRRRKGMQDDVSLIKYMDDPLLVELAKDYPELKNLI